MDYLNLKFNDSTLRTLYRSSKISLERAYEEAEREKSRIEGYIKKGEFNRIDTTILKISEAKIEELEKMFFSMYDLQCVLLEWQE